jgi:hypothetical protein
MTDLVTLQEYKDFKNITSDTQDSEIQEIITTVSAFVERYCDRVFIDNASAPGVVEFWDGNTSAVQLKQFPVISVDYVGVSDDGGVTYTQLVENSSGKDGYFVDDENDELVWVLTQIAGDRFIAAYDTPYKSLQIRYLAGYSTVNSIPADLKLVCFSLIEYYLEEQYTPAKTLAGATIDNPIGLNGPGLPPHIRRILDLYRVSI